MDSIIRNIIKEEIKTQLEAKDYTTKFSSKDYETGKLTWDVDYHVNLENVYSAIAEATKKLQELVGDYPENTTYKLLDDAKSLKNRMRRYITLRKPKLEQNTTGAWGGDVPVPATPKILKKKPNVS